MITTKINRVSLSMVLPVYNEAPIIEGVIPPYGEIVARLKDVIGIKNVEIVVAEDGSTDGTKEILVHLKDRTPMKLLLGENRKGYAKAVGDALKYATGDLIFFSDSDGQYRAKDFWKLWKNRSNHDMVIGWKVRRKEHLHRILLSRGFHMVVRALFGLKLHDIDCGFRLLRREVIDAVVDDVRCLKYSFWAEFTIRSFLKGFSVVEVPIFHQDRSYGSTHIYKLTKIPWIVARQIKGIVDLYSEFEGGNVP